MKRLILIAAFILTAGTLAAQNYIIVNSEKVFKSIDAYNTAISDLDKLAKQYQDQVDAKFAEVEVISPIQKQVFDAIEAYAKQAGADLVLDSANNPTLLYTNPSVERTQQVIDALKK